MSDTQTTDTRTDTRESEAQRSIVAGVTASPADLAKLPARKPAQRKTSSPARKSPASKPAQRKPASRVKISPADVKTPALVLTFAQSVRAALKSKNVSDAEMIKIIDAMIKRASRAGTESTPAQLARHAGIEARDALNDLAKPARKRS